MFRGFVELPKQEVFVMMIFFLSTTLLISLQVNNINRAGLMNKNNNKTLEQTKLNPNSSHTRLKRLPQAIIIGSRKGGTRALLQFLQLNPSIRCAKKEVHFFDRAQNFKLGLDWYRSQMPESFEHELTIEKSPGYFVTNGVAEKIKAMNSSIKLILILRDPVVRLISDYSQLIANKINSLDSKTTVNLEDDEGFSYLTSGESDPLIDKQANNNTLKGTIEDQIWLNAESKFEQYVKRLDGGIDDQRRAVKIGMYSIYLENWRNLFNENQIHFVDGQQLIDSPYDELKKLELFLNLKPTIERDRFVFNERKGFYCIKSSNNSINSNNKVNCLSKNKGRRHVKVREELIKELKDFYAPYNEYLYSLIKKDLKWGLASK